MDVRLSGPLERALARIPERQRAALILAELHDLSGLELAEAMGVSHVAARAILTRARESLRRALAAETGRREGRRGRARRAARPERARRPMTLPFRRRHHDAEAGHDRARTLMSDGLLVTARARRRGLARRGTSTAAPSAAATGRPSAPTAGCSEPSATRHRSRRATCGPGRPRPSIARRSNEAPRRPREPPATRGAEAAGGRSRSAPPRASSCSPSSSGRRSFRPSVPPTSTAQGTLPIAVGPTAGPTGLALPEADPVAIFRETANGSWELVYKDVKEVCPPSDRNCVPKPANEGEAQPIDLGERPSNITLSPTEPQLVIASESNGRQPRPGARRPGRRARRDACTDRHRAAHRATAERREPKPADRDAGTDAAGRDRDRDGRQGRRRRRVLRRRPLAGVLREPADGSTGPDLYLWSPGQPVATAVTSDHQTYFSSWHDGAVLASRVEIPGEPAAPDASAEPDATDKPGKGNQGGGNQGGGKPARRQARRPRPRPSGLSRQPAPRASPSRADRSRSSSIPRRSSARTSRVRTSGCRSSTRRAGSSCTGPGRSAATTAARGRSAPASSSSTDGRPATSPTPSVEPASNEPGASVEPSPRRRSSVPRASRMILVPGLKATFEASFDPDGARLAIWVGEALDEEVGRLHLLVLDPRDRRGRRRGRRSRARRRSGGSRSTTAAGVGHARAARTARRASSRCWAGRATSSARSRPSPDRTCTCPDRPGRTVP